MKHALIITTIGGFVPQFERNDVKILQEYGYTVHYASNFHHPVYRFDRERLKEEGLILHQIDIQKSPFQIKANYRAFRQLREIIRREDISLVHCHNPIGGVVGRLAALLQKKRPAVLYTAHGFHFYRGAPVSHWLLFYPVERLLALCTDCLITINAEDYGRAERFRLRRGGRTERIPGVGMDLTRFCRREELREPVRRKLGIPPDAFHIVSVGELNDNKNHAVMIQAMTLLADLPVCYSICGKGQEEQRLAEQIRSGQLQARVRLLGYRTDVEEVLQSADCFVFPSKREGLGIAAIEAMACEVPVIAADSRGTREYLRDGENGIVCRENTAGEYADAVRRLIEDPDLRARMAVNARSMAERFGIQRTDGIMRRVYREASGDRSVGEG